MAEIGWKWSLKVKILVEMIQQLKWLKISNRKKSKMVKISQKVDKISQKMVKISQRSILYQISIDAAGHSNLPKILCPQSLQIAP